MCIGLLLAYGDCAGVPAGEAYEQPGTSVGQHVSGLMQAGSSIPARPSQPAPAQRRASAQRAQSADNSSAALAEQPRGGGSAWTELPDQRDPAPQQVSSAAADEQVPWQQQQQQQDAEVNSNQSDRAGAFTGPGSAVFPAESHAAHPQLNAAEPGRTGADAAYHSSQAQQGYAASTPADAAQSRPYAAEPSESYLLDDESPTHAAQSPSHPATSAAFQPAPQQHIGSAHEPASSITAHLGSDSSPQHSRGSSSEWYDSAFGPGASSIPAAALHANTSQQLSSSQSAAVPQQSLNEPPFHLQTEPVFSTPADQRGTEADTHHIGDRSHTSSPAVDSFHEPDDRSEQVELPPSGSLQRVTAAEQILADSEDDAPADPHVDAGISAPHADSGAHSSISHEAASLSPQQGFADARMQQTSPFASASITIQPSQHDDLPHQHADSPSQHDDLPHQHAQHGAAADREHQEQQAIAAAFADEDAASSQTDDGDGCSSLPSNLEVLWHDRSAQRHGSQSVSETDSEGSARQRQQTPSSWQASSEIEPAPLPDEHAE